MCEQGVGENPDVTSWEDDAGMWKASTFGIARPA